MSSHLRRTKRVCRVPWSKLVAGAGGDQTNRNPASRSALLGGMQESTSHTGDLVAAQYSTSRVATRHMANPAIVVSRARYRLSGFLKRFFDTTSRFRRAKVNSHRSALHDVGRDHFRKRLKFTLHRFSAGGRPLASFRCGRSGLCLQVQRIRRECDALGRTGRKEGEEGQERKEGQGKEER